MKIAGLQTDLFTGFHPQSGKLCAPEESHSILVLGKKLK
jgi:hypothetical protein